jgi:hypothetical protein
VSDDRPNGWAGPPLPQQTQPAASRQCQHCGWPTPEAEPVCRNCGPDARLGSRRFAPAGPGYAPAAGGLATSTNGLAIASLVLGILWLYWVGSILALVFGYLARRQIAQRQGVQGGRGLATAGIVLGWVGIGFLALFIMVAMVGLATDPTYDAKALHLPF